MLKNVVNNVKLSVEFRLNLGLLLTLGRINWLAQRLPALVAVSGSICNSRCVTCVCSVGEQRLAFSFGI